MSGLFVDTKTDVKAEIMETYFQNLETFDSSKLE